MPKPILSKSTFLRGLKCEKSLWLYKNRYKLKDDITPQQEAIFSQGTNVGILAQDLFPGGVDASTENYWEIEKGIANTQKLIEQGVTIIYEAAFQFDGVYAALDILVKDDEGWKAYEVKSSTSVSETYIDDAAIQYYILTNAGIDLKDISIVYINNQYIKNGDLDINELFSIESVLAEIINSLAKIPNQVLQFKKVLARNAEPNIDIGEHCLNPYECDFMGTCWKHIPKYSVFNISRLRKGKMFDLYKNGVITLDQINLENQDFNANQTLQITSEVSGETYINKEKINTFLKTLHYPIYYLDFETMGSAVPVYDQSRPYQQLVFQYSLHVQEKPGGELTHFEFLAEADPEIDPRIGFIKQLIDECGTSGDILVYNIGFERGRLNELSEIFPEFSKKLTDIIQRMKDLMIPFQQKWYYTPDMKGSYSIKYVLPALVPELSYDNLAIKEGGMASNTFYQMVIDEFKGYIPKTRNDLLEYCKLDTYAMVKILEKIYTV